ncbi:MAG: dockerin type I domain-containing protein [Chloroflexota bacterium]
MSGDSAERGVTGGSNIIADRTFMTLRRSAVAGIAVLLLAVAAACGGGGDGGAATTARPVARKTPSGPCTIARADIDGDGTVSIFDITKVSSHYGEKIPPAPPELDQDGDGAITILDLNLVTSVFVRQVNDCP